MKLFSESELLNETGVATTAQLSSSKEIEGQIIGPRFSSSVVTTVQMDPTDWQYIGWYGSPRTVKETKLFTVRKEQYLQNSATIADMFPFCVVCQVETIFSMLNIEPQRISGVLGSTSYLIFPLLMRKNHSIRIMGLPYGRISHVDAMFSSEIVDAYAKGEIVTEKVKAMCGYNALSFGNFMNSTKVRKFLVEQFKEFESEINGVKEVMA